MKKIFTIFLATVCCAMSWAADFSVDGLYYSITSANTVQVVKPTEGKYSGDITIPERVTYNAKSYRVNAIGASAFQAASGLTSITFPLATIDSIGALAFNDCVGLTEFTLPASITKIGEKAFYYCDNLKDIYVYSKDPSTYHAGNMAFSKIHYGSHVCTLHVPIGCTAAYAADATFSVFTQVEEFDAVIPYNLYINETRVTSKNASDILGDGKASYDAEKKTLTLSGDVNGISNGTSAYDTGISGLTINIAAAVSVSYISIYGNTTITGSSMLTVNGNINSDDVDLSLVDANIVVNGNITTDDGGLSINNANIVVNGSIQGGSYGDNLSINNSAVTVDNGDDKAIYDFKKVTLTNCYVKTPQGGYYDGSYVQAFVDAEGHEVSYVEIRPNNAFVITWKNDDGSTIDQTIVKSGQTPTHADPSKPATAEFTYTFAGWTPTVVAATADATYTAIYNSTKNSYTVTFVDKDDKTIKTEKVEYGSAATAPEAPAVEGYHFTGWDKDFSNITGDLTVKAQYAINTYTVTFVNWDGKELKSETVDWGKSAIAPSDPSREGYTFTGWDKKFDNVTSNLTVTAQYTINVYTVTFVDKDGKTIKTDKVEYGSAATAPDAPAVEGYHFTGWDKDFSNVKSDLTVKAQYAINVYTVTFLDKDGKTLKTEKVEWGNAATAPEAPVVAGWTFAGWDKAFNVVKSDLTVQATYTQNPVYTVTFKDWDGSVITSVKVEEGKSAVKPDDPSREGYTFTGWDKKFDNVTSNLTVTAQYTINTYTVIFLDKNGNQIGEAQTVEWGQSAEAPEAPEVEGYNFSNWDKDFNSITSDLTVKAVYEKKEYTVKFIDWDKQELSSQVVKYQEAAKAPSDPTREGYTFTGWDKDFSSITSDLTVKAQYAINVYTVIFLDKDGKQIGKAQEVEWGSAANAPEAPAVEGYHFTGWDKDFSNVKSDLTVKAQYAINVYTVKFVDKDGKTLKSEKVEHGKSATAPDAPTVEGYHFTGWDKAFDKVTSDLTVKALYAINTYTVTFVDYNDKELKSETVDYGKAATAPSDPKREGYTFKGWDKDFSNVKSDLTVKAQYAINVYTVTFLNKDGKTLKTEKVEWGNAATAPEAPVVAGWTFAGWDKAFNVVKSDLTVQATYTQNPVYTVTFKDWDGSVITSVKVEEGKSAVKPDDPIREGYTFTGWDKKFDNVTSDLTVTAQYTINTYTVIFLDKDGKQIGKAQEVEWGGAAVAPEAPTEKGYHFTGWDKAFDNVTSDLTVKALYAINVYTVTFLDKDGKTLKTEQVEHGNSATAPEAPAVEGYTFKSWDKKFDKVSSDLTVQAQYTINTYTVTFVDKDGKTLKTEKVEFGKAATAPEAPAVEGYHFTGWDKDFSNVKSDLTVKAQYAINVYTVKFVDKDGKTLKTEKVEFGKAATAPEAPAVEGYHFTGWDKDFSNITSDLTVKAQYAINVYTVIFLDKDGKTLKTEKVEHGKAATAPEAPVVEGWTFAGWDKAFNVVKSDLTVRATYTQNPVYTVTFKDYDGSLIATVKVEEGKSAVKPDDPIREGYTFTGWDKKFDNVTSDLTITAQYTINVYTVTFADKDGKTIKTENVEYGKSATAPEAPAVTGYHFTGWDKDFSNVKSDLTVKAQYAINVYTVIFLDKDGNTLKTEKVEHGKSATAPEAPVVEGWTFAGWDKAFNVVKSDLTVRATYTQNPVYTVTFVDYDGSTIAEVKVEEGKSAVKPDDPIREGYIFIGWDKSFDNVTSDLTVTALYEEIPAPDYTPKNLSVVVEALGDDDQQITLSWDAVEGAASYDLRLLLGAKELYAGNTFGMTVISLKLSEIQQVATIAPGTYSLDWFVRSTDNKGQAISDWAQGETFEVTIKDPSQGMEDVNADANTTVRKEMRNGLLYIIRGGRTYDSNGKLVQ